MKAKTFLLALFLGILAAFGAEQEKFSLTVGAVKVIDLPFALESYRVSSKGKVTVEEVNKQQLRVVGVAIGECNLTVAGAGVSIDYSISVKGNIGNVLKRLRNDLENLPELDISINQDYIVIKGTVSNPTNWALLQKVLPLYGETVHSFAVFRPTPETLLNLKKMLIDEGFEFVAEGQKAELGQLDMKLQPEALVLSGELCSNEAIGKVQQILSTQTWLDCSGATPSPDSGKIRGIINLSVVQTQLCVDIVYVAVNESDARNAGTGAPEGVLGLNWLYDAIAGRKNSDASITFGANMQRTVSFLAQNGISRTYNAGYVSFTNHDDKGGSLHTGGTVSVKVSGNDNGSLQDIDYGLTIKVKGGLVTPNRVKLDLDLTNTSAITGTGDAYTRSSDSTSQVVYCDLDKTLVLAGSKKIGQDVQNSGLPILRNTPVLKWFVAKDGNSQNDTRLVILVCPRIAGQNTDAQIDIPLESDAGDVYGTGTTDLREKKAEEDAAKPWYKRWFGI